MRYCSGHVPEDSVKTKGDVALRELNSFCVNKPKLDTVARAQEMETQVMTSFSVDFELPLWAVLVQRQRQWDDRSQEAGRFDARLG